MGKPLPTNKEYLKRFNKKHNVRFKYPDFMKLDISIDGAHTKIKIQCPEHGVWSTTTINNHLKGTTCPSCSKVKRIDGYEWIARFNKIFNNLYIYPEKLKTDSFIKAKEDIIITCKVHGNFKRSIWDHYNQNQGCSKCSGLYSVSHEEFLERLYEKNTHYREGKFIVLGKYKNLSTKIEVEDEFGKSIISPNNILHKNTLPSIRTAIDKTEYLINTYKKFVNNDKNLYDRVVYKNAQEYVEIGCKIHGTYNLQKPTSHYKYESCKDCMNESPNGWQHSKWQKAGETSKNFDSFKVYIIKCWNENEEFYKIGKTYLKLKKRFKSKTSLPYNYKIIKIFNHQTKAIYISELENKLQKSNKDYKYIPKLSFGGMYECFSSLEGLDLNNT